MWVDWLNSTSNFHLFLGLIGRIEGFCSKFSQSEKAVQSRSEFLIAISATWFSFWVSLISYAGDVLQMIMLEGAKATTETVDALRTGAATMKAMQKATYITLSMFKFLFIYFVLDVLIYILFACFKTWKS